VTGAPHLRFFAGQPICAPGGHLVQTLCVLDRRPRHDVPVILARAAQGERVTHYDTRRLTKDGRTIDVSLTVSPIQGAERTIVGASAIARDITERRRVERERAATLATQQEYTRRLEELATLRSHFTAMVAHELAAPIAAIGTLAAMLATGDLSTDQAASTLARIQRQAHLLAELVRDVQAAATAERDDFIVHPRPVPVAALLADAAAVAWATLGTHPLRVDRPPPVCVRADAERIGQVLRNLLGNAAKHTPRIFEKFGRGRDATARQIHGVRLGLYLSRRILQAHGSDLAVEPTPGGGATFTFTLELVE
jgi:signal transduction histidine kinase